MLRLLRTNQPLAHVLVPIIIGLGLLPVFHGDLIPWKFGFVDLSSLNSLPIWSIYCIQFGLIWIGSLLSNRLFNAGHFASQINNFPEFIFALLATVAVTGKLAILPLLALNFILLGLQSITKVYRQNNASAEYFTSALWFGIAALTWKSMVILLPVLLVCILFTRAMNWREYLVGLVGFFLPFLWLLSICYLLETQEIVVWGLSLTQEQFSEFLNMSLSWYDLLFAGIMVVLMMLAFRSYVASYAHSTNQSKNTKSITLIAFFSFCLSGVLTPGHFLLAASLPAIVLVIPFLFIKKRVGSGPRILFYLFLFSAFGKLIWPFAINLVGQF
ncbi:MAG: hypothetical protein ACI9RU_000294 [Litorivivens sp.]|jgi:hypothetical protein